MSSIDEEFVEFVVKSVVSKPDQVKIERRIDEKGVLLELTVDPEDLGRVIGKRGATAQSIRTLLRALGTKNDARYNLKIIDNGVMDNTKSFSDDNDTSAVPQTATDDDTTIASVPDKPIASPATEPEEPEVTEEPAHNDVVAQTRKELEDLDDLDV
jgi:predicted RNA-binding protein YlqC (UPF0109 family)